MSMAAPTDYNTTQLRQLGFSSILNVEGRLSIADLFPRSSKRCGV
jgi:hypothetical protein